MRPFDNHVPEDKHVDMFLLDDNLIQLQQLISSHNQNDKACLHETMLL